jgi:hypothetical protein
LEDSVKGSSLSLTTSDTPSSNAGAVPGQTNYPKRKVSSASFTKSSPDNTVFEAEYQSGTYVSTSPSPWNSTVAAPKSPFGTSSSSALSTVDIGRTSAIGDEESQGSKTPTKNRLPGLGHRSPVTDTLSPLKGLDVPDGFLHHRRTSSRLSLLPNVPSPLGPRHYADDLGSDVSGLVSPLPASPSQASHNKANVKSYPLTLDFHALKVTASPQGPFGSPKSTTSAPGSLSPLPISPHRTRYLEKKVIRTPQKFDLHALKVSTNRNGSTYRSSAGNGFGHDRTITDPFVEHEDNEDKSSTPSPFTNQATQRFVVPQVQVPATPDFNFSGSPTTQPDARDKDTTSVQDSTRRVPATPNLHPNRPSTPTTPFFTATASRVDLPIPPPPLSSTQGRLFHTPETRARLEAQAAIRADWIRTESKKIADLSRLSFTAAQQFSETGLQEDYERWQRFATAYDDATNLAKRQEERRNMFMPKGAKAIKTGTENLEGDGSASFAATSGNKGNRSEGQLLGFQMAYMERVCAEVKRRAGEKKEEEISKEMLDTLSSVEKKALRMHLVARLKDGAEWRA